MRLLDRYIAREVVSHALLGLSVFTFIFFIPQLTRLMELVVRHTESLATVLLLIVCTLPPVLGFTLPMAVLVGVLIGLGRLSADSEIVALHASGISLRRLLLPIGAIASLGAILTLLTTFWLSPLALRTISRLEVRLLSSQAPYSVQPRVFDERFPHLVLYVQDVESAATRWRGVFLAGSGSPSSPSSVTLAQQADIVVDPRTGHLEIHLGSGSTHEYDPREPDKYNVTTFGKNDIPVDVPVAGPKSVAVSDAEESVHELLSEKGAGWRDARVEFHRRIAFPAACLVFALLGVSLGVRPRRGGRATGLILTLVLIAAYYFVFVTGVHMAQQGSVRPWAGVWAANIASAAIGLLSLQLVERVRKQNRLIARLEPLWLRWRREQRRESDAAPLVVASPGRDNGHRSNGA